MKVNRIYKNPLNPRAQRRLDTQRAESFAEMVARRTTRLHKDVWLWSDVNADKEPTWKVEARNTVTGEVVGFGTYTSLLHAISIGEVVMAELDKGVLASTLSDDFYEKRGLFAPVYLMASSSESQANPQSSHNVPQ